MGTSCENCGGPTDAAYCPACGQPVASIDIPATDFLREAVDEVFALDSRASLTLSLLVRRPGAVAADFVAGHRARFVPPIRLYLMASFLMFLVLSFGPGLQIEGLDVSPQSIDPVGTTIEVGTENTGGGENATTRFAARMEEGLQRGSEDLVDFSNLILNRVAQSMFLLLPAFAAILKLAWRDRLYVHHLIFAVYFHAFVFLLTSIIAIPNSVGLSSVARFTDVLLLVAPLHLVFALKRFYGETWPRTILKWGLVTGLYAVLSSATLLGIIVLSIFTA